MAEIKAISYENERLEFFKKLQQAIQKRYNRLEKTIDPDEPYMSERRQLLLDCGRELSFYNDVIEMLENEVVPKVIVHQIFEDIFLCEDYNGVSHDDIVKIKNKFQRRLNL